MNNKLDILIKEISALEQVPQHIAIIMDGNGRWAKSQNLPIAKGHAAGVHTVRQIVEIAREIDIKYLTLYTFSSENWKRSISEVTALMDLLKNTVFKEISDLIENDVRIIVSGDMKGLPLPQRKAMQYAIDKTSHCEHLTLNLALNYGGRREIIQATKSIVEEVLKGNISTDDIDEELFSNHLYTSGIPDPDLLIRTGGDSRISNFLLWQISYAEILIENKFWPDFDKVDFLKAILDFAKRNRRFGGRKEDDNVS